MAEEESSPGIPEWVVTFGDMMSLLLTFFILLVSLSELKQEKRTEQYQAMLDSLRKRFGYTNAASMAPGPNLPRNSNRNSVANAGRAKRNDTMNGGANVRAPEGNELRMRYTRPGEQLTIGGAIWFEPGSDAFAAEEEVGLRRIVSEVEGKPQKIEVRGHTSGQPLPDDSTFRDQWDLAYQRCHVVVDRLIELGIKPRRIRIGIAASNEPARLSDDPLLVKENDRVEVFLLNEFTDEIVNPTQVQDAPTVLPATP